MPQNQISALYLSEAPNKAAVEFLQDVRNWKIDVIPNIAALDRIRQAIKEGREKPQVVMLGVVIRPDLKWDELAIQLKDLGIPNFIPFSCDPEMNEAMFGKLPELGVQVLGSLGLDPQVNLFLGEAGFTIKELEAEITTLRFSKKEVI